jgi:hypothetical protein
VSRNPGALYPHCAAMPRRGHRVGFRARDPGAATPSVSAQTRGVSLTDPPSPRPSWPHARRPVHEGPLLRLGRQILM